MLKTKVFSNGNSQAVRIPKEYRFEEDEVMVNRIGSVVVIFAHNDRFGILMESLNGFTSDFLENGRPAEISQLERAALD